MIRAVLLVLGVELLVAAVGLARWLRAGWPTGGRRPWLDDAP